ncbi:MAG TPA: hypothetical protein VK960_09630 [Acidimicrobiia bacterium]|nr:hypothetical protein [Acidimicrobiia bacterium]
MRIFPVSMVVIGLMLLGGFIVAATSMVAAVVASDGHSMPDLDQLALPAGAEIVDTHATCDANECDGYGMAVSREDTSPAGLIELIESRLRSIGWSVRDCGADEVCMRRDDLAVRLRPWTAVEGTEAAAMRVALAERGVDQSALVYVLFHRCGGLHPCP